tara:strand:- start:110 stop:319 length:210 start_codon:yes stop_codon:yes gene_type:complete
MKKDNRVINLLDVSQIKHKSTRSDKIKTTDINILLNRVKITKKAELKNRIFFLSFLFLSISLVAIIYLI